MSSASLYAIEPVTTAQGTLIATAPAAIAVRREASRAASSATSQAAQIISAAWSNWHAVAAWIAPSVGRAAKGSSRMARW